MTDIKHFEKSVTRQVSDKFIRFNSPSSQSVQQLVVHIIGFMPNYHIVLEGWSNIETTSARLWKLLLIANHTARHSYTVFILSLLSGHKILDIIYELQLERSLRSWLKYDRSNELPIVSISTLINVDPCCQIRRTKLGRS